MSILKHHYKLGFLRILHVDALELEKAAMEAQSVEPPYHFDFYGVGIGGYYLGLFNGRILKKTARVLDKPVYILPSMLRCSKCGKEGRLQAYLDGKEGWWLSYSCPNQCGEVWELEWPSKKDILTSDELRKMGFEIV